MKQKKNLNIEILRNISMFMILILHFFNHGQILTNLDNELNLSEIIIIILEILSIVAVNVFVLISGFFLSKSQFKISKIIRLIIQVWFYSVIIGIILIITNNLEINFKNIIYILFPFLTQRYWFINAYILLLLLSSFINNFIKILSKEKMQTLLLLLFVINSILPIGASSSVSMNSANSLAWFINLYIMASYIRIYGFNFSKKTIICTYLITNIIFMITGIITFKIFGISKLMYLLKYNLPFVYISSITLFLIFINIKKTYNKMSSKVILFISSSTFPIYIIHENCFIRNLLWNKWLNIYENFNKYGFIYMFLILIIIYFTCIIIDKIIKVIYTRIKFNLNFLNKINEKLNF